jgi:hypothetical protein
MAFADEEEPGQILSQNARGRVLVSRERRESLLEEYDRSGVMAPLNQCFLVKIPDPPGCRCRKGEGKTNAAIGP